MRKWVIVLLCALACAKGQAPAPVNPPAGVKVDAPPKLPEVLDRAALGSSLGKDGTVTEESMFFKKGEPIYLTMVFRESPGGLVATAQWMDGNDTLVSGERKLLNGTKVVTFKLETSHLEPGPYHVVGWWGGDVAVNRPFAIQAKTKGTKR